MPSCADCTMLTPQLSRNVIGYSVRQWIGLIESFFDKCAGGVGLGFVRRWSVRCKFESDMIAMMCVSTK